MARILILLILPAAALFGPLAAVSLAAPDVKVSIGHTDQVLGLSLSHDGRVLLTAGLDDVVKVWETATGREIRTIPVPELVGAEVSGDGRSAIVADSEGDGHVVVLDLATGKEIRRLERAEDAPQLTCLSYAADGARILLAAEDGAVSLWDPASGETVRTWSLGAKIGAMAPSPDGKRLATTSGDETTGALRVFELEGGAKALEAPVRSPKGAAWSADGRRVVAWGYEALHVWDAASGARLSTMKGHRQWIYGAALAPDGKLVASAGNMDDTIRLWDAATGKEIRTLGEQKSAHAVAFTPDGRHVLSAGDGPPYLRCWDVATGAADRRFSPHASPVFALAAGAGGKLALACGEDGALKLWEPATGKLLRSVKAHAKRANAVATTPDGSLAATGAGDKTVKLWDAATGKLVREIVAAEKSGIRGVDLSRDGRLVLAVPQNEAARVFEVATGREVRRLPEQKGVSSAAAFAPDGKRILVANARRGIVVFDAASGAEVAVLGDDELDVEEVALDGAGALAISCGGDQSVRLWDLAAGKEARVLVPPCEESERGHYTVFSVALSADGKRALSGHIGATKLWDTQTGVELLALPGHVGAVTAVAFLPGGKLALTGGDDGTLKLWSLETGKCIYTSKADVEGEWITWTADGFFNGSEWGQRNLIHVVDGLNVYGLDQLFERYFDPALVCARAAGRPDPAGAAASAGAGVRRPPLVRILSPTAGETLPDEAARVVVDVLDQGGGVDEVRLYQNGKLVSEETRGFKAALAPSRAGEKGAATPAPPTPTARVIEVRLAPGSNLFRAVALASDRTESAPAAVEVTLAAAKPVAALHVLAVGINAYENPKYSLTCARPDAEAFVAALEKGAARIFAKIEKRTLYDERATRAALEAAVGEIAAAAKPQDAFVFYFAGHGVMSGGEGAAPPEFHLAPRDVTRLYGDEAGLAEKAVSGALLKAWSRRIPAQKQLFVLDACQSGGALESFAVRGAAEEKAMYQLARSAGVILMAATGTEQFASEVKKLGHGVFTYAILEGLAGAADGGAAPDGKITVRELEAYLDDRVPELTREHRGAPQYPQSFATGQDFPLAVK